MDGVDEMVLIVISEVWKDKAGTLALIQNGEGEGWLVIGSP